MTTVLITGGAGMLGRHIVPALLKNGHTPRVMSRRPQPTNLLPGTQWVQAELESVEGISRAVSGVDVIIHAASSPFRRMQQVDIDGTRVLLEQARAAGVAHVIYISIIGIDRIPLSYYRYKLAAETLIQSSGLPWSILRAAQFHYFIDAILRSFTKLPVVALLPADLKCQPVDEQEVADCLCEIVDRGPGARLPDLAGPEILTLGQMTPLQLSARKRKRILIPFHLPGKVAQGFRAGYNTCPDGTYRGTVTWAEWLQRHYQENKR